MSTSSPSLRTIALAWLEQSGERRYVDSETRIGRGALNDIHLDHPSVSRDHAIIRRVDGNYVISDLNSANGTFVNDERVHTPRLLTAGDRVRLAGVEFRFNVEVSEPSAGVGANRHLTTSISQFLTMSGHIDAQEYLEGDLRVVTVLFLDLCGFTALSERISPEQVMLVVNQCFQHLTETAAQFDGFIDKYIGDAMMVLFGAPQAHDDDAERAVRAAIAMLHALASFSERLQQRSGIALQMRVGINTGEVLAGRVGSAQFSAFTVMGDTVNLAKRLEEAARVGHILVSDTTYRLTRERVRYTTLAPQSIRGKHEPVATYEVAGLLPAAPSDARQAQVAPFVGRQAELSRLDAVLGSGQRWRTIVVHGQPAIGKSRLIDAWLERQPPTRQAITLRGADSAKHAPYAAVRAIGQQVCDALAPDEAAEAARHAWADLLADDQAWSDPNAAAAEPRISEVLAGLVEHLARRAPLILVIEGVEDAPPVLLAVLGQIAQLLAESNVVVLLTTREQPSRVWSADAEVIALQPLSRDECHDLTGRLLESDAIEPDSLQRLVRWAEGSPLYIEEIVAAALAAGTLHQVDGTWHLAPEINLNTAYRLRTLVQAALDRLEPAEVHLLRMCTLMGGAWSADLLADALEAASVERLLAHLVDLGYLVRTDQAAGPVFGFAHEVTRAVVEASLPKLERRRLHERLALALQRRYDPDRPDPTGLKRIAQHFASAGQHWRGVEYLLRSADLAASGMPPRTAVAHYRGVLDEAQTISDPRERARLTVEVQERIGEILLHDASLAEAQIAFELAHESSTSEQRRAEFEVRLATIGLQRGTPRPVLELAEAVLSRQGVNPATRASAEALAAMGLALQGLVHQAAERAACARDLAAAASEPAAIGRAHYATAQVQLAAGALAEAVGSLRLSAAARRQAGEQSAWSESLVLMGAIQSLLGELAAAEASVREALAGWPAEVGTTAVRHQVSGATLPQGPDRWTVANAAWVLGRLLAYRGDRPRAERRLERAFRAAEPAAARGLALRARLELVRLRLTGAGASAAAVLEDLQSALEASVALDLAPLACELRTVLAEALCRQQDDAAAVRQALKLARAAAVDSRSLGLELHAALAQRTLGMGLARLGYWSHAARELERAGAHLEQLGARVELVRTLIAAAEAEYLYAPSPDVRGIRARLISAIEFADAIGLEPDRVAAAHLLGAIRA